MKKGRAVLVVWEDSASLGRPWIGDEEKAHTILCRSVGFIHQDRKRELVIAQSRAEIQVGHLLAIPRSAIRSIHKLKGQDPASKRWKWATS